jgi:hypothetical protein
LIIIAAILIAALVFVGFAMFMVKGSSADAPTMAAPPPPDIAESAKADAPRPKLLVEENGTQRVSCEGACALEVTCGLRTLDDCRASSCDDAKRVRTPNRSDFCMASSVDGSCADVVTCTCEEACWKKGECTGDHTDNARCTAACKKLVEQDPVGSYRDNRCMIENKCADIAACGAVDR